MQSERRAIPQDTSRQLPAEPAQKKRPTGSPQPDREVARWQDAGQNTDTHGYTAENKAVRGLFRALFEQI